MRLVGRGMFLIFPVARPGSEFQMIDVAFTKSELNRLAEMLKGSANRKMNRASRFRDPDDRADLEASAKIDFGIRSKLIAAKVQANIETSKDQNSSSDTTTLETYNGWYLTSDGNKLHFPDKDWPLEKGGPNAHGVCGAKLSPYRTDDHVRNNISHPLCGKCAEKEQK